MKKRKKRTPAETVAAGIAALHQCRRPAGRGDALAHAQACANLPDVDPSRIVPRVNLLTYNAWNAYGLNVEKGEKAAARVPSFGTVTDPETGKEKTVPRKPAALFHITQTVERDDLTIEAEIAGMDRSIPRTATLGGAA